MKHQTHSEIVSRLRKAEGHLRKVIAMIEEGRPCLDVAPQLHAVEHAIGNAKTEFIRDHIDHCLDGSSKSAVRTFVDEFKTITKYL